MTEKIFLDFGPNDFIIRLAPHLGDNGRWTGELSAGHLTTEENDLHDEDYEHLDKLAMMLMSCIELLEDDVAFRSKVYQHMAHLYEEVRKPKLVVNNDEDNVIEVDFSRGNQ